MNKPRLKEINRSFKVPSCMYWLNWNRMMSGYLQTEMPVPYYVSIEELTKVLQHYFRKFDLAVYSMKSQEGCKTVVTSLLLHVFHDNSLQESCLIFGGTSAVCLLHVGTWVYFNFMVYSVLWICLWEHCNLLENCKKDLWFICPASLIIPVYKSHPFLKRTHSIGVERGRLYLPDAEEDTCSRPDQLEHSDPWS